jgi:hypothetical protein
MTTTFEVIFMENGCFEVKWKEIRSDQLYLFGT